MNNLQIADLNWLTPTLAVGGDLHPTPEVAAAQVKWLGAQGVTDIVDCRAEWNDADLVAGLEPGIRYHHLPTDDHGGQLDATWWQQGVAQARNALDGGGTVFVHCHMGINRGPSMAFAVLIDHGWDPIDAFHLIRARRPQAFLIYAPQYLTLLDRTEQATELQELMRTECDHTALVHTIGMVRKAEQQDGYRFPIAS